jgi:hypothetical protein
VALFVTAEIVGPHVNDASLVDVSVGDVPGLDEVTEPLCGIGINLVVVGGHLGIRCPYRSGTMHKRQTYPNGSETTDGRYLKVGDFDDVWWDQTGIDLVSSDVVEAHMIANQVGIMVFSKADVVTVH